jgi:hypothetical protein
VSARSRQRSSPRSPDRELESPWAPGLRQELVDAQAEADLEHRRAETRDLEAKTAREDRRADVEIALLEASTARIWLLLLMTGLLAAIGLILGAVDSGSLASSGFNLFGEKVWILPKVLEGG